MKMRSVSTRRDIFLSYAHMNIEFARRIKVRLPHCNLFLRIKISRISWMFIDNYVVINKIVQSTITTCSPQNCIHIIFCLKYFLQIHEVDNKSLYDINVSMLITAYMHVMLTASTEQCWLYCMDWWGWY